MPLVLSGDGITSDNITSLAASKLTGTVPNANAPSGSVIQVVHSSGNTTFSSSATSFVDSPQSIVITPKFSNSKIVIQMVNAFWTASSYYTYARIVASGGASGTIVTYGDWYSGYYGNTPITGVHTGHNTTSAITYKLQGRVDGSGFYMPNNNSNGDASTRYYSLAWEIVA
jgi:hypothetical protein